MRLDSEGYKIVFCIIIILRLGGTEFFQDFGGLAINLLRMTSRFSSVAVDGDVRKRCPRYSRGPGHMFTAGPPLAPAGFVVHTSECSGGLGFVGRHVRSCQPIHSSWGLGSRLSETTTARGFQVDTNTSAFLLRNERL